MEMWEGYHGWGLQTSVPQSSRQSLGVWADWLIADKGRRFGTAALSAKRLSNILMGPYRVLPRVQMQG